MNTLNSCVPPISGEHIVSDAVCKVLMGDGRFSISGLPWLEAGEAKTIAPPRTNCLCCKHNSALNSLDDAAKYLFASLKSFLETTPGFRHALISGHDLERWLLKTAKAVAVSRNFARDRERLSGVFSQDKAILDMLDDPQQWQNGAGLYCTMNEGDLTENTPHFQLQPLTNNQGNIEALSVNIIGLCFVLLLESPDWSKYPALRKAKYRPGRIVVSTPTSIDWLTLSWEDHRAHEALTVRLA